MGTFSLGHLIVVLLIIVLLFGTKKLKNIGSDIGGAINSFRRSMRESEKEEEQQAASRSASATVSAPTPTQVTQTHPGQLIEGQVTHKQTGPV